MRKTSLSCLLIGFAISVCAPSPAAGQTPLRGPVHILLAFPGDVSYALARLIGDGIAEAVGQPVVIENKPGATGRIAAEVLRNAAPDGTTLAMFPLVVPVIAPLVFKQFRFDPTKDFLPVSQVAKFQYAFAVAPGHPARTVQEFIAWARVHPDRANFGTAGAGSVPHFFGIGIARAAGIELLHIPYKNSGEMAADLMGNQLVSGIDALANLVELHRAGKLRIIATSDAERSPLTPQVPTLGEQGYPAVQGAGWVAVFAPARTPGPVIDQLSAAIAKAMRAPGVRERFAAFAIEPTGTTRDELAAIMAADTARWAPIVKASGFVGD